MSNSSPFVIPESAHRRYLEQKRRQRRKAVREALALGLAVPYDRKTLQGDGWGPRTIDKVTDRQLELRAD